MEILPKDFDQKDIQGTISAIFEPAINITRLSSCNGQLIFTNEKVYILPETMDGLMIADAKVFGYDEIASYKKTGLAGFRITLKDGTDLNFSNVFGKMRKGITAALEEALGQ